MKNTFVNYSDYYDLLYKDKDYSKEAIFIADELKKHGINNGALLLELGCGTGQHANLLSEYGYQVTGVDFSQSMIDIAREKNQSKKQNFIQGDIRNINLDRKFDAVISLFHVFSYQTTNSDITASFETASKHLRVGGILIFDFWYAPGVIYDPPVIREKIIEDENYRLKRLARPEIMANKNLVNVNYSINFTNKNTGDSTFIEEDHLMRYFHSSEIDMFSSGLKLKKISEMEWFGKKPPTHNSWIALSVFKKI